MYDTIFGPDFDDVASWQEIAVWVLDGINASDTPNG
jgi:hypothetical protein